MKKTLLLLLVLLATRTVIAQSNSAFDSMSVEFNKVKAASIVDKNDKAILKLLNKMHDESLQADEGNLSQQTMAEYQSYKTNKQLKNQHVFYLFDAYQNEVTRTEFNKTRNNKNLRIAIMKILSGELIALYHDIPPIVLVYMGEALMNSQQKETAREHFKMSLEFYPKSIPLKMYNYLLAEDSSKKERLYKELTKKHKNHWMVKQFLSNP